MTKGLPTITQEPCFAICFKTASCASIAYFAGEVGRAADYVLRNNKQLLRVFIYAPKSYRIKNVMNMYNDDERTAEKNIDRADKNRAEYYSLISGQKWGDPENYDLCIDASLGKEKVVEIIADLARIRS